MPAAPAAPPAEVAGELLDQTVPVKELLKKVPLPALAKAWLAGEVEFGRRAHVVTGKPGTKSENVGSVLLIEDGINWTGAKTVRHKPLKELLAEEEQPVECAEYRKYAPQTEPDANGRVVPNQFKQVPATKQEAHAALALLVRLTDKGLAALRTD